jgi:hypothetical protein
MYYYFQRCRVQEQELQKWRAGLTVEPKKEKPPIASAGEKIRRVVNAVESSIREMPSPSLAMQSDKTGEADPVNEIKAPTSTEDRNQQAAEQIASAAPEAEQREAADAPVMVQATPSREDTAVRRQATAKTSVAQASNAEAKWASAVQQARSAPNKIVSAYDQFANDQGSKQPATVNVQIPRDRRRSSPASHSSDDAIGSYLQQDAN